MLMLPAQFLTRHTLAYVAGFALTVSIAFLWRHGWSVTGLESAILGMLLGGLFGMFHAAMFSVGCAWAGVQQLPRMSWAFAAALITTAGLFLILDLTHAPAPPTELHGMQRQDLLRILGTAYVILGPALAGLLAGWLWKRRH